MLVNNVILEDLKIDADLKRTEKAEKLSQENKVKIKHIEYVDDKNFEISAIVAGTKPYRTYVDIKDGYVEDISCTCEDYYNHYGVCKHTLASVLEFNNNPQYKEQYGDEETENREKNIIDEIKEKGNMYRNFNQIVNVFYNEEIEGIGTSIDEDEGLKNKGTIKIEPSIYYDKFSGEMKVEFKIGNKNMYKIKNLSEFYTRMMKKEFYKYGSKLQFIHVYEAFEENSKGLLDFILKYSEIIKYANSNANSNYRYYGKALSETSIILGNSGIDDFFDVINGKEIVFDKDYQKMIIKFTDEEPDLKFILTKSIKGDYQIIPNKQIYNIAIIQGKNYKYLLDEKKLYRCSKEFENSNLKLLEIFRKNYMTEVEFGKEELTKLFSIIIPKVKNAIDIKDISEEELEKYKPKELCVKVFLDFDKNDYLIADVKFQYGNNEMNPLDEKRKVNFPRNMIEETKALNIFRKSGFMLDVKNLRFILPNNDKIYEFLTDDINYYTQKFELMVTDNFKTKQIRTPKMSGIGVKIENDLLQIDLKNIDIDAKEIKDIMEKYSLKKKYHRLKDGSFIDLENSKEIDFLDKLVIRNGY